MSVPVGITVPKLLPITGTFAPAFATWFAVLAIRVSSIRINTNKNIGDNSSSTSAGGTADPLFVATRCHQNFAEHIPLALFMGAVVEMNGGNRRFLTGSLAALFVCRILHVELGLKAPDNMGLGRAIGHMGTLAFMTGMSGYAAWLVKGYWGF